MKIVHSAGKKWLEKEGYSKKIFLDEKDLNHPGALVQKIKIKPGDIAQEHYHKKQTEIFYFLNENGYWIINGKEITFKKGDLLVLEPFDKHIVLNKTKKDYTYLSFKINYEADDLYWT